jgi:hypothetical protein
MHKDLQVVIITCCRSKEMLPTATLTFKTVRTGYPNADIVVYDNGSEYECKEQIEILAHFIGATWESHMIRMPHAYAIQRTIANRPGKLVFLDGDLIFWDKCEDWEFDFPIAGRHIPTHVSEYTKCETISRLHTSHLWVDTVRTEAMLKDVGFEDREFAPADLWHPHVVYNKKQPTFYDVGANLYHAISGSSFQRDHLSCYDHIFSGSTFDHALVHLDNPQGLQYVHHLATTEPARLRGLWKDQQVYFTEVRSPGRV